MLTKDLYLTKDFQIWQKISKLWQKIFNKDKDFFELLYQFFAIKDLTKIYWWYLNNNFFLGGRGVSLFYIHFWVLGVLKMMTTMVTMMTSAWLGRLRWVHGSEGCGMLMMSAWLRRLRNVDDECMAREVAEGHGRFIGLEVTKHFLKGFPSHIATCATQRLKRMPFRIARLRAIIVFVHPVSGHAIYSKGRPPSCGIMMFFIIGVGSGCCPSLTSLTRTIFCETE